jgi:hypothetical protein
MESSSPGLASAATWAGRATVVSLAGRSTEATPILGAVAGILTVVADGQEGKRQAVVSAVQNSPRVAKSTADGVALWSQSSGAAAVSYALGPVVAAIGTALGTKAAVTSIAHAVEIRKEARELEKQIETSTSEAVKDLLELRLSYLRNHKAPSEEATAVQGILFALGSAAALVGKTLIILGILSAEETTRVNSLFTVFGVGAVSIAVLLFVDQERSTVPGEMKKIPHKFKKIKLHFWPDEDQKKTVKAAMAAIDAETAEKNLAHKVGTDVQGIQDLKDAINHMTDADMGTLRTHFHIGPSDDIFSKLLN